MTEFGKRGCPPANPWQMTREEFVGDVRAGRDFPQLGIKPTTLWTLRGAGDFARLDRQAENFHEGEVIIAFASGKPVPAKVLKNYLAQIRGSDDVDERCPG